MNLIVGEDIDNCATILNNGGIIVYRTDTVYGLLAKADRRDSVERLYLLKGRDTTKSPIVLVADNTQLMSEITPEMNQSIHQLWPGKVSIIVPHDADNLPWLTRGNKSIAYRVPNDNQLRALLKRTGPLVAPSANPQGMPIATTINQAKDYFGEDIDLYVDGGEVHDNIPSTLLRMSTDGSMVHIR